jgi:predicted N-acetyltransferase YhbS
MERSSISPDGIAVLPPAQNQHVDSLYILLDSVWQDGVAHYRDHEIGNSHYDWQVSRIAVSRAKVVSHWGVWGYEMRVGNARLNVGGVGSVATHSDYRRRGLMTRNGHASLAAMRRAGYDMTVLHGYTHDYKRFGYVRAWTYTRCEVETKDLPLQDTPPHPHAFNRTADAEADVLYNQTHAPFTGTAVRPTFQNLRLGNRQAFCWYGVEGQKIGYVWVEPQPEQKMVWCLEAVGQAGDILGVLRQLAQQFGCERIVFEALPYAHPVVVYLRGKTCQESAAYQEANGWMVLCLNLKKTLEKLIPEFSARLAASMFAAWQGDLLISDGAESVTLSIEHTKIRFTSAASSEHALYVYAGNHIAQLLIGTYDPLTFIQNAPMQCSSEAEELVQTLFPRLHPSLGAWDQI